MFKILLFGVFLGLATGVFADDSGSFDMMTIWKQDYHSMNWPEQHFTIGTLEGTSTIMESSGDPFPVGVHHLSTCLVYAKRAEGRYKLEAHCTLLDESNDAFHIRAIRDTGDTESGGGGPGRWEFMGGTGKYSGIVGGCDYVVKYLDDERTINRASDCKWHK